MENRDLRVLGTLVPPYSVKAFDSIVVLLGHLAQKNVSTLSVAVPPRLTRVWCRTLRIRVTAARFNTAYAACSARSATGRLTERSLYESR
jgi:hypothetical protein